MILKQLFNTESSTYSYLIADSHTRKACLIDPVLDETDNYLELLEQQELELIMALDTHTHADHITALGRLREHTHCQTLMGQESLASCLSAKFSEGDRLIIGNLCLHVLHTPGHTDDSYSFYLIHDNQPVLFTGDTLLIQGTGRTDFQNGDAREQYASLFDKLLQFPDHTLIYPGHDYNGNSVSTIGSEKRSNPRLQINDVEDYIQLMSKLQLPNPKQMDIAIPANQACGDTDQLKK